MKRKHVILLTLVLVLAVIAIIQLASAENTSTTMEEPETSQVARQETAADTTAGDLAIISGLPEQAVLDLYTALGDWEIITENIFIYKQILALAPAETGEYAKVLTAIQKYEAGDLLAVLQFLADKYLDVDHLYNVLERYEQEQNLETVLTQTLAEKDYQNYTPAGEEQIRQWLAAGYLPQDIINADAIAMPQDLGIFDVLQLKTEENTWEEIGQELGYDFDQPEEVAIAIQTSAGLETLTAANYQALVDQANRLANRKQADMERDLMTQLALPKNELIMLKQQGLNLNEIKNLVRLVEETGATVEDILTDKKAGLDWEDIIARHEAGKRRTRR